MSAESELDWLCEKDVAYRSGLPGPLVEDLIPRLPTPTGVDYHNTAQVYTEDSVYRSRLALLMLRSGIRLRYIQFAMREPMTRAELKDVCQQWAELAGQRSQSETRRNTTPRIDIIGTEQTSTEPTTAPAEENPR